MNGLDYLSIFFEAPIVFSSLISIKNYIFILVRVFDIYFL